jgi:two-component system response regulator BaeR
MSLARILVVEDEPDLAAIVADYARAAGYETTILGDGAQALAALRADVPDLVVLDLMLPGLDGVALCRAVRAFSDVPILMVTARVAEADRLLGLGIGADDYLCKPFSPRELVARIGVILRRARREDAVPPAIAVDAAARVVRIRGAALALTPTEYGLFAALAQRPGAVWTRAQLLDALRADALGVSDRAIDSHVKNLRRKIELALPGVSVVESVYGLGYRVAMSGVA